MKINLKRVIKDYDIIFADIDDTLFNYTFAHNTALEKVMLKYNFSHDDYNKAKKEIKERHLSSNHHKKELYFKTLCENKKIKLSTCLSICEEYDKIFNENLRADSSMMEMFKTAKALNKTIVAITNFYVIQQLTKLKTTGFIDLIDFMVTSEEFEIEKPSSKLFNKAMELCNNPDPSKVIMFGDSTVDDLTEFNISYHPYNCSKMLISISGKSGAGKSTLCSMLEETLQAKIIEADGYHKYERDHPEWKNVTHYNPNANNLLKLGLDIKNIFHNISNISVPIYNHHNGKFDKPKELKNSSLDIVIIEGLHTLYKEVTGDFVTIKIYLDSDKSDDQKLKRDITERSKDEQSVLSSIQKREQDFNKYIDIQKEFSNFLIEVKDNTFKITITEELSEYGIITYVGEYKDLINTVKNIMISFKNKRYINNV